MALIGVGIGIVESVQWTVTPGAYAHDNSASIWLVDFKYIGSKET